VAYAFKGNGILISVTLSSLAIVNALLAGMRRGDALL
jgi:hypothetical protein